MLFKNMTGILNDVAKTVNDIGAPIAKECGKAALKAGDAAVKKTIQISKEAVDHTKTTIELKKESKAMIDEAKDKIDDCAKRLASEQLIANEYLEELGKLKIDIEQNEMVRFDKLLKKIMSSQFRNKADATVDALREEHFKQQIAPEMVNTLGKGLTAGIVSGTTTYVSVALLGSASTGTAISALHGAAATKATLAFLGGGTLSAGGAGVAGGIMVLGGIIAVPVLVASGIAFDKSIRSKYENACSYQLEANKILEQTEKLIGKTKEITAVTKRYTYGASI